MSRLTHERYEAELGAEAARIGAAALVREADLVLPTCPQWTMRDLVEHVGSRHRWAAAMVAGRARQRPPFESVAPPADRRGWPDWLAEGAYGLVKAVREVRPDEPVWTWHPDRRAAFWLRRMLHDGLIHRVDAEFAVGLPGEVAPEVAADGIAEMLSVIEAISAGDWHPLGGLRGADQTLAWHASDVPDGHWVVRRTAAGVRPATGPAQVTISAPARDLLLVLNRRLGPEHAEISGDRAVFEQWQERSAF